MMKINLNVASIVAGFLLAIIGGYIFYNVIKVDYNSELPKETWSDEDNNWDFGAHLKAWDKSQAHFPFGIFLDSADYSSVKRISYYLQIMDSLSSNFNENKRIISIALTDSLQSRINNDLLKYNPDSIVKILQWIEGFNQAEHIDKKNARLYRVINAHWLNYISNRLAIYFDNEPNLKYDFKFKYIESICRSKSYAPPIGNSDIEKIAINIFESKFSYLFSKFWFDTGFLFKLVALLIITTTTYGYFLILKTHLKR